MIRRVKQLIITAILLIFSSGVLYCDEGQGVAVIKGHSLIPYNTALKGFKRYLKEHGFDFKVTECSLEGKDQEDIEALLKSVALQNPKLILTLGTSATRIAQERIRDIPIVFTMVLSPERSGISPPGVSMDIPFEKKLKKLRLIVPHIKTIGMVYSPDTIALYEELSRICGKLGFGLCAREIRSQKDFPKALKEISREIDCFFMIPDPKIYFRKSVEYLLVVCLKRKIPVVGLSAAYVKAGALVAFDCDYEDLGEQAAELALRTLSGKASGIARIERPREVTFSLNLLTAKRMKIQIAKSIIKETHQVFGK